jgi:hypothetical protein
VSVPCEIYVRHSGGANLLNAYGDVSRLDCSVRSGEPVAFVELSVLPEWITDIDQRIAYMTSGQIIHVRIPIHDQPTKTAAGALSRGRLWSRASRP